MKSIMPITKEDFDRLHEIRKNWKFVYPTKESITKFFEELRIDIEEDKTGYWKRLKEKSNEDQKEIRIHQREESKLHSGSMESGNGESY